MFLQAYIFNNILAHGTPDLVASTVISFDQNERMIAARQTSSYLRDLRYPIIIVANVNMVDQRFPNLLREFL
jgi:hypothetical protein